MKRPLEALALLFLIWITSSCSKSEKAAAPPVAPEPPKVAGALVVDYDETEIAKAIATARSRVGEFIEALAKNEAESYSVNVSISDGNGTEQFWIAGVSHAEGKFTGRIEIDPEIVRNVKNGQTWTVAQEEISDWMFTRDGKIHGGFTIDPLLATYPKEEADALRAKLVR
jgi:uncharacterized protein YegJ (DUF2314 family)